MCGNSPAWSSFTVRWAAFFTLAVLAALSVPGASAQQPAAVTAADLDVLLERVRREVELLRYHMGKPENTQGPPAADQAQPHEAFLQAQNLFRKANRLARELVGAPRQSPPVAPPASDIVVSDIAEPLEAALEQVLAIKSKLGITSEIEPPQRDASRDLTSLYRATVQTNRQLNLMTEESFTAEDVYQQISLAITYAGGILAAYTDNDVIPAPPALEPGKSPADVYAELVQCMLLNRRIAESVGFPLLRYDPRGFRRVEPLPSDVYDLATLLVSYISHMASRLDAPEIFPEIEQPEYVFPFHTYQHALVLHQQLSRIANLVEKRGKPERSSTS